MLFGVEECVSFVENGPEVLVYQRTPPMMTRREETAAKMSFLAEAGRGESATRKVGEARLGGSCGGLETEEAKMESE